MNNKALILGLALLVGVAGVWQWQHTRAAGVLQQAADKANLRLPRPYINGLVMERAHVVDDRLVIDIHIPDIRLAQLEPKKIPVIRHQEQGDLVDAACVDPDLRALMHSGTPVARRFLDQDHKLIFEIAASEADCAPKAVE